MGGGGGSATAQRATIYSESTTVSSHEMKGSKDGRSSATRNSCSE